MLKIGLDIDDVLAEFMLTYLDKFGKPKSDQEITKNVENILKFDRDFWINLPVLNKIYFNPALYCTKRVNNKRWTKAWLENNEFPHKPVYQMFYQGGNKADMIKGRVDVFIDDSVFNFVKMNLSGVPCLLFNKDYNQSWGPIGRLYSLDEEEINLTYELFMETTFYDFKNLL